MSGYGGTPHVNLTRLTCPAYKYRSSLPSVRVCSLALASARPIVNLKTALAFAAEQGACACTPCPACPDKQDVLIPESPVFLSPVEKSSAKSTR